MTLGEILDYYAGLLIIQYRIKPKAKATIQLVANQSVCDGLVQTEQTCFDLDTAIGAQLTVLGKIVGASRNVYGLDLEHVFFNFTRYLGEPVSEGFARYSAQPDTDLFYRYNNYAIYTLTDFELRALIYLKIIFNNRYSSFKDIKEALYAKFGNDLNISESPIGVDTSSFVYWNFTRYDGIPNSVGWAMYSDPLYIDNMYRYAYSGLMQLTYAIKSIYRNTFEAGVYLEIIPKPMGVKVNAVYH